MPNVPYKLTHFVFWNPPRTRFVTFSWPKKVGINGVSGINRGVTNRRMHSKGFCILLIKVYKLKTIITISNKPKPTKTYRFGVILHFFVFIFAFKLSLKILFFHDVEYSSLLISPNRMYYRYRVKTYFLNPKIYRNFSSNYES